MRATLPLSALILILCLAPASAMCGGQQAQAATPGPNSNQESAQSGTQRSPQSGMMCGRPAAQAQDPFGMKPSAPQQSGMGMCPCCRGMAMMRGGMMEGGMMGGGMMGGGMKQGDDPHKGMDMPPKP